MATPIISREEARAQGLKRFFTGDPCRNGHVAERLVSNGFCRECYSATWQRYRERHPAKVAANSAKQNKRLVEEGYFKSYYRQNDEKRKEQASEWYDANREHALSKCREWVDSNRDRVREIGRRGRRHRRARLAQVGGTHTQADLDRIYLRQGGKCAACKCSLHNANPEVDHIIPISRGGHNGPANLQYLCRPCNRAKSAKDPLEFAQERGLLL
jgi:5-methylcytosine-specific restriction endonuclease McrA